MPSEGFSKNKEQILMIVARIGDKAVGAEERRSALIALCQLSLGDPDALTALQRIILTDMGRKELNDLANDQNNFHNRTLAKEILRRLS